MFAALKTLANSIFGKPVPAKQAPLLEPPVGLSSLQGFTIMLEHLEGYTVTPQAKQRSSFTINRDVQDDDITSTVFDTYIKITIHNDGTNPEYPNLIPWITNFTSAASRMEGHGHLGHMVIAPFGSRWVRFEVAEGWDDGELKEFHIGKLMPPHHFLQLRAVYVDGNNKETTVAIGTTPRKSDVDSPAWQAALRSNVHYM